jgi:hypothetical protein
VLAISEFPLKYFDRAANSAALQLNKTAVEGDPAIHGREKAKRAFASNVCSLDSRPVLQNGQQRKYAALGEISVLEKAACIADDSAEFEADGLKMGLEPLAAGTLQGTKQAIAPRKISLSFEHGDITEVLARRFLRLDLHDHAAAYM